MAGAVHASLLAALLLIISDSTIVRLSGRCAFIERADYVGIVPMTDVERNLIPQ